MAQDQNPQPDDEAPDAEPRLPDDAPLPEDAPLPVEEPPEVTLDPSMGGIPASAAPPDSSPAAGRPPAEDITEEAISRDAAEGYAHTRRQPGSDDSVDRDHEA